MHMTLDAPLSGAALFHTRCGGFPLFLCSYALLDESSNDTVALDQVVVIRVTALNGGLRDEVKPLRLPLHGHDDIRRFLAAVYRPSEEVTQ